MRSALFLIYMPNRETEEKNRGRIANDSYADLKEKTNIKLT